MLGKEDMGSARDRERHTASAESQGDRDRSLEAMHALEAAVGRPGSGAVGPWKESVVRALDDLLAALAEQRAGYEDPTSLLAQIGREQPRLRTWVRQLQHRWTELGDSVTTLRDTIASAETIGAWTVVDAREQVRWLMSALHHHRAREADLVFEALDVTLR